MCQAGPDAVGLGRDHWNEMLAYPRKPITHWHALGEVQKCSFNPFVLPLLKPLNLTELSIKIDWINKEAFQIYLPIYGLVF